MLNEKPNVQRSEGASDETASPTTDTMRLLEEIRSRAIPWNQIGGLPARVSDRSQSLNRNATTLGNDIDEQNFGTEKSQLLAQLRARAIDWTKVGDRSSIQVSEPNSIHEACSSLRAKAITLSDIVDPKTASLLADKQPLTIVMSNILESTSSVKWILHSDGVTISAPIALVGPGVQLQKGSLGDFSIGESTELRRLSSKVTNLSFRAPVDSLITPITNSNDDRKSKYLIVSLSLQLDCNGTVSDKRKWIAALEDIGKKLEPYTTRFLHKLRSGIVPQVVVDDFITHGLESTAKDT